MKKTVLFIIFAITVLFAFAPAVSAAEEIDVYVNGVPLDAPQPAILYNGRTMVPIREICESLSCTVDWDQSTRTAIIKNEVTIVGVQINNYWLTKKDRTKEGSVESRIPLDVAPILYNSKTLVPVRAVSEALHAAVEWNNETRSVYITLEYDFIGEFTDGYAHVGKNGFIGVIDENRKLIVSAIYDEVHNFNGYGEVVVGLNGKYGTVDTNDKAVFPMIYEDLLYDSENDVYIAKSSGKYGCIDRDGEAVIDFEYDELFCIDGMFVAKWNDMTYQGNFKNGKFHGEGELFWESIEKVYRGDFKNGEMTGYGTLTWSDGDSYEGEFSDGELHGEGIFSWADGASYEGEWNDGDRTGYGVFTWPDGAVYEGDFLKNERHGNGTFVWPTGKTYEGEWRNDVPQGQGIMTHPDGEVIEGEWDNGEYIG